MTVFQVYLSTRASKPLLGIVFLPVVFAPSQHTDIHLCVLPGLTFQFKKLKLHPTEWVRIYKDRGRVSKIRTEGLW